MKVWMYYETDGISGYYSVILFQSQSRAEEHKKKNYSVYGRIREMEVHQ